MQCNIVQQNSFVFKTVSEEELLKEQSIQKLDLIWKQDILKRFQVALFHTTEE